MARRLLHIRGPYDSRTVEVDGEISIGRTDASTIVIDDTGLSRRNTTFFIDGDDLLVVDEKSTNGTILNGQRLGGAPKVLRDGDVVTVGNGTTIRVEFAGETRTAPEKESTAPATPAEPKPPKAEPKKPAPQTQNKTMLYLAAAMTVVIIAIGGAALLIVNTTDIAQNANKTPVIPSGLAIPKIPMTSTT
jgi:pSer/pThr/pTyr-binding forkhead associated (FHA) protein